jgi:hypothetical protein
MILSRSILQPPNRPTGELFPTGKPEVSSILSLLISHAANPAIVAPFMEFTMLSSALQQTATSRPTSPAEETNLLWIFSMISSKYGEPTTSLPRNPNLSSIVKDSSASLPIQKLSSVLSSEASQIKTASVGQSTDLNKPASKLPTSLRRPIVTVANGIPSASISSGIAESVIRSLYAYSVASFLTSEPPSHLSDRLSVTRSPPSARRTRLFPFRILPYYLVKALDYPLEVHHFLRCHQEIFHLAA